jgi:uncharacterized membrane protein
MTFLGIVVALWVVLLIPPLGRLPRLGTVRDRARYAIGLAFVFGGLLHFLTPARYLPMMPPWLPWPIALIYVSGFFEIAGGLGLLVPRVARLATFGLILLLLAVFPANLHAALTGGQAVGMPSSPWYLWARLPFQFVYIAWLWYVRPARGRVAASCV